MSDKYTKEILKPISKLTKLNTYLFNKNQLIGRNEITKTAYEIFGVRDFNLDDYITISNEGEYEIINNHYDERFMIFIPSVDRYLVMGPFLLNQSDGALVRKNHREQKVSLKTSQEFIIHHQNLSVYTRRFCQSLMALLEQMYKKDSFTAEEKNIKSSKKSSVWENYRETVAKTRIDYRVRSPIALENRLLYFIKQGNINSAAEALNDINSLDSAVFSKDPVLSKKYSLVAGCTLYTRAVINGGIDYMTAFALSDAVISTISTTKTLEELNTFEYEMLELFCELTSDHNKELYPPAVESIIDFISVNLTTKITLNSMSQSVHLHPNYISNLFKKEVGVTIFRYIQKMRVDESKLLLLGTDENIASISTYYHFCNQAYYIKIFKEHEKITPGEYRERNRHL